MPFNRCKRAQLAMALALLAGPLVARPVTASEGDSATEIEALKSSLAALRSEYDRQIEALEARILELEHALSRPAAEPPAEDDLAALRAAAHEAASSAGTLSVAETAPAPAQQQSLNRLNPEISATGIILGISSDLDRDEFQRGEFELDLQANLDPFSRMRWTIAFTEEGEVEIEEGYLAWNSLPGGLGLTAGRFRQRFGALNRQHLHALPQAEYPLVLTTVFGEEGLGQTGVSASWLLPKPWASANEFSIEITDGENEFFAGEEFEHFALLSRLTNYWDLSPAAYFEWGLTGIVGRTEDDNSARVWGTDLTYHWQPPARGKYREITWRTEVLLAQRENLPGEVTDAWGGYTYLEGLIARNLYLGTRFDWTEDPFDPLVESWAIAPYLTWWQSEWVRLRGEYQRREEDPSGEVENRFSLQLTWAAGPHKHETY